MIAYVLRLLAKLRVLYMRLLAGLACVRCRQGPKNDVTHHPLMMCPKHHDSLHFRVSVDALCALHVCALGISPVTSYSGVKRFSSQSWPTFVRFTRGSPRVQAERETCPDAPRKAPLAALGCKKQKGITDHANPETPVLPSHSPG